MSITVVTPNSDINNPTLQQLVMDSKIPFTKLDTTKIGSFQTISILFNDEPPQSPSSSPYYTNTLLYQFAHGYNYIPGIWAEWQNSSPEFPADPSSPSASTTTFYAFGDDTSSLSLLKGEGYGKLAYVRYNDAGTVYTTTLADLIVTVIGPNVYISVMKYTQDTIGGSTIPLYLAGVTLDIRIYVFSEPSTTSTY